MKITVVTILLATFAAPAFATDFTAPVHNLDGKPASECKEPSEDGKSCKKTGPITIGELAAAALSIPDRSASLEDQVKRGRLAMKVLDAKDLTLQSEDITLIKNQMAKLGVQPVYVVEVVNAVEPAEAKKQP